MKQFRIIRLDDSTWAIGEITYDEKGNISSWEEVGVMASSKTGLLDEIGKVLSGFNLPHLDYKDLP